MVRFGEELRLNLVPEWQSGYIDYDKLKDIGDTMPATFHGARDSDEWGDQILRELVRECARCSTFFAARLEECKERWRALIAELTIATSSREGRALTWGPGAWSRTAGHVNVQNPSDQHNVREPLLVPAAWSTGSARGNQARNSPLPIGGKRILGPRHPTEPSDDDEIEVGDLSEQAHLRGPHIALSRSGSSAAERGFYNLYTTLHDLQNYRAVNIRGFYKAIKKIEKNAALHIRDAFEAATTQLALVKSAEVAGLLEEVTAQFAATYCDGDSRVAVEKLRDGLHELVTFRRNTIWQDQAEVRAKRRQLKPAVQGDFFAVHPVPLAAATAVLLALLALPPLIPNSSPEAARCMAMLAGLVVLWSTEAIPLYVTALLVPLLSVLLRVLPGRTPSQAGKEIVGSMTTHTILLVLAGFSIASALHKFKLDRIIATAVLARAGGSPKALLLLVMAVSAFLSMWLSNVAAPVLVLSIVMPALQSLKKTSTFRRSVLLGTAVACNVGGMLTPIASPQNIAALQALATVGDVRGVSFGLWMACALPIGTLLIGATYLALLALFPAELKEVPAVARVEEGMRTAHYYVLGVTGVTVALLCATPALEPIVGDVGIAATVPLVLLYAPGVLDKEEFEGLPWNVIYLVAGGLALGHAVSESQLLQTVSLEILKSVGSGPDWALLVSFVALTAFVTSLISHTVGALILLPVVASAACSLAPPGEECDVQRLRSLVLCCAFMCSGSMALPVSSFPNTAIISETDVTGEAFVKPSQLLPIGLTFTFVAMLTLTTLGYSLTHAVVALG